MTSKLNIDVKVDQIYAENTYILNLNGQDQCLVIDPGFDFQEIIRHIETKELEVAAIVNTHGHIDHIVGNQAVKDRWPDAPIVIGTGDAPKLTDAMLNLSGKYGLSILSPPAERTLNEGDVFEEAGIRLHVLETPGHSEGHIVLIDKVHSPWIVYYGAVLCQGGIGRTDFPDGSFEDLVDSIHRKLFTLPDDTIVFTGHGEPTTIGDEKRNNPFVGLRSSFPPR